MDSILNYVEANRDRYLKELFEFLKIPSISTTKDHAADHGRGSHHQGDSSSINEPAQDVAAKFIGTQNVSLVEVLSQAVVLIIIIVPCRSCQAGT